MAQRRMISPQIVNTDAFLDMPVSSQVLYFHLAIRADDDGFITPKMVMRLVGANQDDLKVLITKRFLLAFESGVVVIKHWLIHNLIRADMYRETTYLQEKNTLGLNEYGAYTELRDGVGEIKKVEPPKWLKQRRKEVCTDNGTQTAPRLGKVRLGKDKKQPTAKAEGEKFTVLGAEVIKALEAVDPKNKKYYNNKTQRSAADFLVEEYGLEEVKKRISILHKTNKIPYWPTITTPCQLRDKWVQLEDAAARAKQKHGAEANVAF